LLLTFFAIFAALSVVLIIIGFALDISIFSLVGTISLMLIGGMLLAEGLNYKSGEETIYIYGDNYDGYHYDDYNESAPPQLNDLNLFETVTEDVYTNISDTTTLRIAWLLIILGGLGFALSLFNL